MSAAEKLVLASENGTNVQAELPADVTLEDADRIGVLAD